MKLSVLAKAVSGCSLQESENQEFENIEIESVECDSRFVKKNSLFCCIKGLKSDGHDFIADAIERGASAICLSKECELSVPQIVSSNTRLAFALFSRAFLNDPSKELSLVGVTGTNGKTTTTFMIEHLLEFSGIPSGLMGTLFTKIGNERIVSDVTTPDAGLLQKNLAKMKEASLEACVFEVSSHSLALDRVAGCHFDRAVFTNLTQDHLDFHKDFEDYFCAKQKLFDSLESSGKDSLAVINIDDQWGERIVASLKVPFLTYGIEKEADFRASDIHLEPDSISYILNHKGKDYNIAIPVSGFFNVYNSLGAIACVVSMGVAIEKCIEALSFFKGVKGRFELVACGQSFTVVVDYAHTPDGLYNVLKTARGVTKGRVIAVFGCGGDRDKSKRPLMGRIASELADFIYITSDNPRTEIPERILDDIEAGLPDSFASYLKIPDREKAIRQALSDALEGDFVVIAGKGHEDYQIIGTEKRHFDDAEVVREYFNIAGRL